MSTRLAFVALCLASPPCLAQFATDADMAQDALGVVGHGTPEERSAAIQLLGDRAYANARNAPDALGSAAIVFSRGLSVDELGQLADEFQLEVTGMNVKAPLNDAGVVQSLLIGSGALVRYEGSFEARANQVIDYHRCQFLRRAELEAPEVAKDLRRMVASPMRVYGADVFGTNGSLYELMLQRDIALVRVKTADASAIDIAGYRRLQADAPLDRRLWEQLEDPCSVPSTAGEG